MCIYLKILVDMACSSCFVEYGFFKKEYGCAHCGFSFCSKCLVEKLAVPRKIRSGDSKPYPVCFKCSKILKQMAEDTAINSRESSPSKASVNTNSSPGISKSRSKSMKKDEPQLQSYKTIVNDNCNQASKSVNPTLTNQSLQNLTPEEQNLHARLQRLKSGEKMPVLSQCDIERRVADLKGITLDEYNKPNTVPAIDKRSDVEKYGDLMDEMKNEAYLDSKMPTPSEDIENRLRKLRGEPPVDREYNIDTHDNSLPESYLNSTEDSTTTSSNTPSTINQIDSYLSAVKNEAMIEAQQAIEQLNKDDDVKKQLKMLRNQAKQESLVDDKISKQLGGKFVEEDSDEDFSDEQQANNIVQKTLAEAELDCQMSCLYEPSDCASASVSHNSATHSDAWCCICTDDAQVQCMDCHNDLYCRKCFKQEHKDVRHKWTKFGRRQTVNQ